MCYSISVVVSMCYSISVVVRGPAWYLLPCLSLDLLISAVLAHQLKWSGNFYLYCHSYQKNTGIQVNTPIPSFAWVSAKLNPSSCSFPISNLLTGKSLLSINESFNTIMLNNILVMLPALQLWVP